MPNTHQNITALFDDIADAIREQDETTDPIVADTFPARIRAIPSGGGILPSEYQQVEYIESTGTQYIDTGYTATANTNVEIDMYVDSNTPQYYCGFGAYASGASFQLMLKSAANFVYYCASNVETLTPVYGTKIRFVTNNRQAEWVSSSSSAYCNNANSHVTSLSLGLFAGHEAGGFLAGALMRCYSFKIYERNELAMELVPCYRKSDNEIGMYDIVTDTFFTNAGTGTFTKGADV